MKILFLDIDGVVNNRSTPNQDGWPIDHYMALLVGRIVEATGCSIVLSSSWRYDKSDMGQVARRVMPFIDVTPMNKGLTSRGSEIKEWLDLHPEVEKYAILDDATDMLAEQIPHFFKTMFEFGLTDEIAGKVIEHLK